MAAKRATTSIPIVFFAVYAPVEIGLVPNLSHPGGNITGVAVNASDMAGKRVQLLKDLVPTLKRVAMLSHPPHPTNAVQVQGAEAAARAVGVQLETVPVRGAGDFASALKALPGIDGVLSTDTPLFVTNRARLVGAVAASRLPAIYPAWEYVEAGGLMSYGPNVPELWRRAGVYVDKILKGAKPGELPVEQPATFELAINARTAKAMGLTIPRRSRCARIASSNEPQRSKERRFAMIVSIATFVQLVEPSIPAEVVGAEVAPVESVVIASKREAQVTQRPPA